MCECHLGPGLSLVLLERTKFEAPFFWLFVLCDNLPTRCGYARLHTQPADYLLQQVVLATHTHERCLHADPAIGLEVFALHGAQQQSLDASGLEQP